MIFQKIPELSYKEIVTGLKKLGFYQLPNKSTGHEQWVKDSSYRKVTVSKHLAPFDKKWLSLWQTKQDYP